MKKVIVIILLLVIIGGAGALIYFNMLSSNPADAETRFMNWNYEVELADTADELAPYLQKINEVEGVDIEAKTVSSLIYAYDSTDEDRFMYIIYFKSYSDANAYSDDCKYVLEKTVRTNDYYEDDYKYSHDFSVIYWGHKDLIAVAKKG